MSISQVHAARRRASRPLDAQIGVAFRAEDCYAGEIVGTALIRSFTAAQVAMLGSQAADAHPGAIVWINPPESAYAQLADVLAGGGKAIVLGHCGPRVAELLGLEPHDECLFPRDWAECLALPTSHHDESPAAIQYAGDHALVAASPLGRRPLCRFDFADEWNNHGFGRIRLASDPWSLAMAAEGGAAIALARVVAPQGDRFVYAALHESDCGAVLWFNRPVGPVDSLEWQVVEAFLGDYRTDELVSFPYLGEFPAGYRAAVCARLDCDEAVASGGALLQAYRDYGIPLSLALLTGQPIDAEDVRAMRAAIDGGGSVVSHSQHHYPNWGGSYERALDEAVTSRAVLERHLPEAWPVRYAVSPFHQNPDYAVRALADSGYDGFLGGIIANDPEYMLGRAGRVPFAPWLIVSHSAQSMLHGDCFGRYGNSIEPYAESFRQHVGARAIFGYLDHPLSARYQYGWSDESTRIAAHCQLIENMRRQSDIWWASIDDVLSFLVRRDRVRISVDAQERLAIDVSDCPAGRPLRIHWKGRELVA